MDIFRLIGAILVIVIHANKSITGLFYVANTFGRYAVPLFMMITGYFYFKVPDSDVIIKKNRIKRLAELWAWWCIVYLPLGLAALYNNSSSDIFFKLIKSLFGISVFYSGSWYLVATIFGLLVIDRLRNKKGLIVALVLIVWLFDLVVTNYNFVINNEILSKLIIAVNPNSTIITGILWIGISYLIVVYEKKLRKMCGLKIVMISFISLNVEFFIVEKFHLSNIYHDMYILLPFSAIVLFVYLLEHPIFLSKNLTIIITHLATLIFFVQFGCIRIIKYIFDVNNAYVYFSVSLVSSILVSIAIFELSRTKYFKFLQILY